LLSQQVITVVSGGADGFVNAQWVLTILASIMLTYSIGDIIYSQVLLPMNKEKIYLITMTIGAITNIVGSVLLGKFVFVNQPVVGVAIATSATDVLILAFLIARTRQYVGKALFNWNSLKIVVATVLVAVSTYFLSSLATAQIEGVLTQIFVVLLIDAIVYVGSLMLMKERLVHSFVRKRSEENN